MLAEKIEPYISIPEVAKALGLTEAWIIKSVYHLGAPSHKVGGRKLLMSEYRAWLKQFKEVKGEVHGQVKGKSNARKVRRAH